MKPRVSIRLLGRFSVHCGDQELLLHSSTRAREILGYLAVNRRRPVSRESLAEAIFPECSAEKLRKAMRQALWQLRADLSSKTSPSGADRVLGVEPGWVQFVTDDRVWLDIADFERMTAPRMPKRSGVLDSPDGTLLVQAVELYRGDFLEGWFRDWCLEERERLRQIYLGTLDTLVAQCESRGDIKSGIAYAALALHTDSARECTHRSLMRLYSLMGDRASALRQYERCCLVLRQELGIGPDEDTIALEAQVRKGRRPRS
jgi:DNA-binding SARP family transcriptional activator